MSEDREDTKPDADLTQLMYEELLLQRSRLHYLAQRVEHLERIVYGMKMTVELIKDQCQSNGSSIANMQKMCRSHGEVISRLIDRSSEPPKP